MGDDSIDLLDLLSDEHKALVAEGSYAVDTGDGYPVLRWAKGRWKGRLAPGTGIAVKHNDIGQISKDTAYQRRREYRQVLEDLIPADADETRRGTLGWLMKQGMLAAEGVDIKYDATCPECGTEFTIPVMKRPDTKAILGLMEMVIGRAPEQRDINVRFEDLQKRINEQTETREITVHEVSPHERALREEPETDGEFKEVDHE